MTRFALSTLIVTSFVIASTGLYSYNNFRSPTVLGASQVINPTGEVTLSLSDVSPDFKIGTESVFTLTADTGSSKLVVLEIELSYDPTKVSTPVVTHGDFLENTLSSPKVENGKITFSFAAPPSAGGIKGIGTVATIALQPTSIGTSSLSFTGKNIATAIGSDGKRIPTNTLKSTEDATIVVADTMQVQTSSDPTNINSIQTNEPNFFKKIVIGWRLIFQNIFGTNSN